MESKFEYVHKEVETTKSRALGVYNTIVKDEITNDFSYVYSKTGYDVRNAISYAYSVIKNGIL